MREAAGSGTLPGHTPYAGVVIDWAVPDPRPGWRGGVDRFFGPGQTRTEVLVQGTGLLVCGGLVALLLTGTDGLAWWQLMILGVFAFDAIGGVLTNATGSAKRWYHRPGTGAERLRFVSLHVVHLALIGLLVLPQDWAWLGLNVALLGGSAWVVERSPAEVQRPVALGLTLTAVLANQLLVPLPGALSWVALVFYLKLLVAHLVVEAPFRSR